MTRLKENNLVAGNVEMVMLFVDIRTVLVGEEDPSCV